MKKQPFFWQTWTTSVAIFTSLPFIAPDASTTSTSERDGPSGSGAPKSSEASVVATGSDRRTTSATADSGRSSRAASRPAGRRVMAVPGVAIEDSECTAAEDGLHLVCVTSGKAG